MKSKTGRKLLSFLLTLAMVVGLFPGMSRTTFATDNPFYTLDGTITGGGSTYAKESDITQNNVSWKVKGNTLENPWRIGGKSISGENRDVYSTGTINSGITEVMLELGNATITVNSVTLTVASDSSFSTVLAQQTKNGVAANSTLSFKPTSGTWSNAYYKFTFNVTNSNNSNKHVEFKAAKFYGAAATVPVTGVTLNPSTAQSINVGGSVAFTATVAPDGATDKTVKWSTTGSVTLYSDENCTAGNEIGADATSTLTVYAKGISAGSATVTCTSNADSGKSASCAVTAYAASTTVTWNPSDIVPVNPLDKSFTKDDITITAASCDFQTLTFGGGGTFTTTLGNFTKIEISADYAGDVSGTGWSNDGWQSATWTGNAASVSFSGDIWGGGMTCDGGNLTIVFTIATVPVTGVTLNPSTAQSINVGDSVAFTATVAPNNATDKKVKWSTTGGVTLYSDENCTAGNEIGADATSTLTVYAKGISAGSATVTVTSNADSTKSASCAVTVAAAASEPENIIISPASGDIAEALAAAEEGKTVGDITINLTEGVTYTISNTIVAPASLTINGNGAIMDAGNLNAPMIALATIENPTQWTELNIAVSGLYVNGLKKQMFYSACKNYLCKTFTVDNCVVEVAADVITFDFTKGSVAESFVISNSTFYAPTATTKPLYSSQSGQKAIECNVVTTQSFKLTHNTFFNLAPTKNFFVHRQNNQMWLSYEAKGNVFANCGKSGQVIKGLNGGGTSANPTWDIDGNLFNYDGADTSAAETTGDNDEPVKNSVAGVVTFVAPASGNFNGTLKLSGGATLPEKLGDPRFTLSSHTHSFTYSATSATITATCGAEGCDLTDSKATLTIVKPTLETYLQTGAGISATASLDGLDAFNTATGLTVAASDIKYYGVEEYEIEGHTYKNQGDELAQVPTAAGEYVAGLTLSNVKTSETETGDVIARVWYTIAPASISSVTVTGIDAPVATEALDTAATTSTANVTLGTVTWNPTTTPAAYATQYTATVIATAATNYAFADDATATVNGETATVTVNDDGTLSIAYTFEKTALTPVTITPTDKEADWSADGIAIPVEGMFTITEGAGEAAYAVENGTGEGTYDAQTGKLTVTKCGTFTVKVSTVATETHVAGAETTATLTVNKVDSTVATVTANNFTYDAAEHPLVTVTGEATGGTMQYALGTATEATEQYTTSVPTATDGGTYFVWYKVQGDDNHSDVEAACVTVTVTTIVVSFEENGGSEVDDQIVPKGGKAVRPEDPTRLGYDFVDWYADEGCTEVFDFETVIEQNTVVYALWKSVTFPETLTLAQDYLLLLPGETFPLEAVDAPRAWLASIAWSSDNESVATVDDKGKVTAVSEGVAWIKATLDPDSSSLTALCRIDVTDEYPEVTAVRLVDTKATAELYSTDYTRIEVLPELLQNQVADRSASADERRGGPVVTAIENARFADAATAAAFDLRVVDDRTLEIVPKDEFVQGDAAKLKTLKSNYKSAVIVTIDGQEFTTPQVLQLSVKKTKPRITAKIKAFNSFIPGDTQAFVFSGGVPETVVVESAPAWLSVDTDALTAAYMGAVDLKLKDKVILNVKPTGWAFTTQVTVNVSVAKTAPKLSLSPSTVRLNPGVDALASANAVLGNADPAVQEIAVLNVMEGKTNVVDALDVTIDGSSITVRPGTAAPTDGKAHTYKVTLALLRNGMPTNVTSTLTVRLLEESREVSVTAKAAGAIDPAIPESPVTVTLTAKNANAASVNVTEVTVAAAAGTAAPQDVTDRFDIEVNGLTVTFRQAGGAVLDTSLTYTATIRTNVGAAATVKLTVKTNANPKPTVSLKAAGAIDVIRPDSAVTVTATVKDCFTYAPALEDLRIWKVTKVNGKNAYEPADDKFDVRMENGVYVLTLKPGSNVDHTTDKFAVSLSGVLDGTPFETAETNITVKMGYARIKQSTKSVTLLKDDRNSRGSVTITVTTAGVYGIDWDKTLASIVIPVDKNNQPLFEVERVGEDIVIRFANSELKEFKSAKVKVSVFLLGNNSTKPNTTLTISVKLG